MILLAAVFDCSPQKHETSAQRAQSAKALFERTTKLFHIPSAEAKGTEKEKLQEQAAKGYEAVLNQYPEQEYYAAQALRSLGNIRAAQERVADAVKNYAAMEKQYPQQRWEILMSWKSAADLLWEHGKQDAAREYYQKIVARYDRPEAPQVEKTIVRGSRARLAGQELPAGG
jgi:TolA-binding protein